MKIVIDTKTGWWGPIEDSVVINFQPNPLLDDDMLLYKLSTMTRTERIELGISHGKPFAPKPQDFPKPCKPRKPRSNRDRCNGHSPVIECGGECLAGQCLNEDCSAPSGKQCRTICGDYLIEH